MTPKDRLIIALDLPDIAAAQRTVKQVGDAGMFYKIGYQLIPIGGLPLAEELSAMGKKIFLDFKFHDIGATVERGVRSVAALGADFLTVHAEPDTLKGAIAGRGDDPRLKILAVTVLTSLDQVALGKMGITTPLKDLVLQRAEMAAQAGADGVVASAKEAAAIKQRFGNDLEIVTPGIRPKGANADDQKRIVTPQDAIAAGADYLVVGRPVVHADDPTAAASTIISAIASAK